MPPGSWMLHTSAVFQRVTTGAEGTRPQVTLRYNASRTNPLGDSAGTIQGVEISETAGRELRDYTAQRVVLSKTTVFTVYGFGEDDASAAGGGQIEVQVAVTWARG